MLFKGKKVFSISSHYNIGIKDFWNHSEYNYNKCFLLPSSVQLNFSIADLFYF